MAKSRMTLMRVGGYISVTEEEEEEEVQTLIAALPFCLIDAGYGSGAFFFTLALRR